MNERKILVGLLFAVAAVPAFAEFADTPDEGTPPNIHNSWKRAAPMKSGSADRVMPRVLPSPGLESTSTQHPDQGA